MQFMHCAYITCAIALIFKRAALKPVRLRHPKSAQHGTQSANSSPSQAIPAGTLLWQYLLNPEDHLSFGDAFYFAVVTFTTIGYGDLAPATPTGKVFFMIYVAASLIVQLTVLTAFVNATMEMSSRDNDQEEADKEVRAFHIAPDKQFAACFPFRCCPVYPRKTRQHG
jgi:hypothetical protein